MADRQRYRSSRPVAPAPGLPLEPGRTAADYEFRVVTVDRGTSIHRARELLADEAEYGKWELARTRRYEDGARRVWLRRRIIRMTPQLG